MQSVDAVRSFSRAYTQRIGLLEESYLGTGRALAPSRMLFEIADEGSPVGGLRLRLGMDSGYASRLLRQLETDGLVSVEPDPDDRRRRIARLTPDGKRERRRLDDAAQRVAADLLAPLGSRQQDELAEALGHAERILRAATVEFTREDPDSVNAVSALNSYFAELDERMRTGFDTVAGGTSDDAVALSPPSGAFLVMSSDESVIGCGGVLSLDDTTGEIKRMWVHREWRGLGLGLRMLSRLEEEAVRLGRRRVVLDTNEVLTEAVSMYERAGYHRIERYNDNPYAHHWFAKSLENRS